LGVAVGAARFLGSCSGRHREPHLQPLRGCSRSSRAELLPIIGSIIAAIGDHRRLPARAAGAAFLLYLAIQQVENALLVPKIQGDAIEPIPAPSCSPS
jgi:hypothetical protein